MEPITLNLDLQAFVEEQVRKGHFRNAQEVVEAGVTRLMLDAEPPETDEETLAAIKEAQAQYDRGEGRPFKEFAAEMRARFPKR